MSFNVGDLVVVKTVEEMIEDGGSVVMDDIRWGAYKGDILFSSDGPYFSIYRNMDEFCGYSFAVKQVNDDGSYHLSDPLGFFEEVDKWYFIDQMLKPEIQKKDDEFFPEDMDDFLSDFHVKSGDGSFRLQEDDELTYYYPEQGEVIAIYHNPDSTAGGTYMIHHFPYDYIDSLIKEHGKLTKSIVWDHLFGDAFHCFTECIDRGTEQYNLMYEWGKGDEPEDEAEYLMELMRIKK